LHIKTTATSATIEGYPVTEEQMERALIQGPSSHNEEQAIRISRAVDQTLKLLNVPLTEEFILRVHSIVLEGGGRYRDVDVRVGHYRAPGHGQVPGLMKELVVKYSRSMSTIDRIIEFHVDFEMIHPFRDGNGRTGRVILNWMLARAGYPPFVFIGDRMVEDYYRLFDENRDFAIRFVLNMYIELVTYILREKDWSPYQVRRIRETMMRYL
jgi:Fic family protein